MVKGHNISIIILFSERSNHNSLICIILFITSISTKPYSFYSCAISVFMSFFPTNIFILEHEINQVSKTSSNAVMSWVMIVL